MEDPVAPGHVELRNGSLEDHVATGNLDPSSLLEHIASVLAATLGASRDELDSDESFMSPRLRAASTDLCSNFIDSPQVALFVQKELVRSSPASDDPATSSIRFTLTSQLSFTKDTLACVAILKRSTSFDSSIPINDQLSFLNLPGASSSANDSIATIPGNASAPYEALRNLLQHAMAPVFDAYTTALKESDSESRSGISTAKRQFAELELSLRNLEDDSAIPELHLPINSQVQAIVDHARAEGLDPQNAQIPASLLADAAFLNTLTSTVNGWTKAVRTATLRNRDPGKGQAKQEMTFWASMEAAVASIVRQSNSGEVKVSLKILKQARRHAVATSFESDTGLDQFKKTVNDYNQFFREIPLDNLLKASSLDEIQEAVAALFNNMKRAFRRGSFPAYRLTAFVTTISASLDSKIRALLKGRIIMRLDTPQFKQQLDQVTTIFVLWITSQKDLFAEVRNQLRKTGETMINNMNGTRLDTTRIETAYAPLQQRLEYIRAFRDNHEHFRDSIARVLDEDLALAGSSEANSMTGADAVKEIHEAYQALEGVDVLDTSVKGTEQWSQAESLYNSRISRVESMIIDRLRDRLAVARATNESFRVLSRFNPLFTRPKIRGAVADQQSRLISQVSSAVRDLQERYRQSYGQSEIFAMSQLRDLPLVSGAIIRAQQIDRQLDMYMTKVEQALGEDWHEHVNGKKLFDDCLNFKEKLNPDQLFHEWRDDVMRKDLRVSGRLFTISRIRAQNNALKLNVDFEPQVVTLFKEVRNMTWLGFSMPHAISAPAKNARKVYPFAVSLTESLDTLSQALGVIDGLPGINSLLNQSRNEIQLYVSRGLPLRWETIAGALGLGDGMSSEFGQTKQTKHVTFISDFASKVQKLKDDAASLVEFNAIIEGAMAELESAEYAYEPLRQALDTIQKSVDQMNLKGLANLEPWVNTTNSRIRECLRLRLTNALHDWLTMFDQDDMTSSRLTTRKGTSSAVQLCKHEIVMRDRTIYLDPPLEEVRATWLTHLHNCLIVVCRLPILRTERFDTAVAGTDPSIPALTFSDLPMSCIPVIQEAYDAIGRRCDEVHSYIAGWLQYQSLWDLQMDEIQSNLGESLFMWLQLLREVRQRRETFDTTETNRKFPHLVIDYEQIQVKVGARYDQWQRELTSQFASRLSISASDIYTDITSSRKDLETHTIETSSTSQAVACITAVQLVTRKIKEWQPQMRTLTDGQRALSRQRFAFPANWLLVEQIDHEWAALNEALDRRSKIIAAQSEALKSKIIAEDKILSDRVTDLTAQWDDEKPISGQISPTDAIVILQKFDESLGQLNEQANIVAHAKEALGLPPGSRPDLSIYLEEISGLKLVWNNLKSIWDKIAELRDQSWQSVQPRKLRQSLEGLLKLTRDMPSRMRQYDAFQYLQTTLQQLIKVNGLLSDMRSEAVKDRHWDKIFKSLRPNKRYVPISLTLGDVYDLKLGPSESIIREVLVQAQGEMALEEFLRDVRETWQEYNLDLVNYQNRCRLIRGWDDLFSKCSEQLNALQAMRHSAYYKIFEEEASAWEDKLNRIHVLFDVWIDVQRQWVYLEGVFTGNIEIKHLLPTESNRFTNINNEFMAVLKKVYKSPLVSDVVNIPGVQKSLERLADQLNRIQKALGEYLERERMSFPRFYFVGDEDLLEIIGNSNDTDRVSKHLRKMFAGVSGLVKDEESVIVAVISREGEQLQLSRPVSLAKGPRVNEWLSALEQSIHETVAESVGQAFGTFQALMQTDRISNSELLAYIDGFPAQTGVLGAQIWWTHSVDDVLTQSDSNLDLALNKQIAVLKALASLITQDLEPLQRKKCEHLITEFVHQRDAIEDMISKKVTSRSHYIWQLQMRYVYDHTLPLLERTLVHMANAKITYGCEYLGCPDRLVRTPLTDRCFLTLTQALFQRLGGSPYGPAGTGKTESVKALGNQLGRFTLVFNCDDTFDYQAMGRIFLGISQVGAWGCFDEFNRLEERILSAVSQQIQNIQTGLRKSTPTTRSTINLLDRNVQVHPNTGMFITMNPGYAGRSNLPDNLKKLFRSVAMSKPDKELIAEVMLFSQGFEEAKVLSRQTVPFFDQCSVKLTKQPHYDFGLRALKSVLVSAGSIKRGHNAPGDHELQEPSIIVQSLRETIAPKLIREDINRMKDIERDTFPGVDYSPAALEQLRASISQIAQTQRNALDENWFTKIIELYQIQNIHHGVMMVGNSSTGKSTAWRTLLAAMQVVDGVEGVSYVIDPKVMSKEELYGHMDSTTREWTDGLFTSILRKIVDNLRGESAKRHWIVFDGDVDPEWVENLNSVLDDNRLLTLPNGERLALPSNVRIMFEVETLKYATLATVSRCGMIWFSDTTLSLGNLIERQLAEFETLNPEDIDDDSGTSSVSLAITTTVRTQVIEILREKLLKAGIVAEALLKAQTIRHIMVFTEIRALTTLFSLLRKACRDLFNYNLQHSDFPLEVEVVESYIVKKVALALVWSFAGDCPLADRKLFGDQILAASGIDGPHQTEGTSLIDYTVALPTGQWAPWHSRVPTIEVNPHQITQTDLVVPTVDTVRHEDVLYSWLAEHKPLILCGPPGSGKTMTLFSALRKLPAMEVVGLNFSSATTPDLLIKVLEQHCEYKKTSNGTTLSLTQLGRWLVVFCDEINLPSPDKYGTQRVISFLRQLVERRGFWRTWSTKTWVTLERVQFVGACNPPTDVGRTPLSQRFLRHAPLVMVDYPGELSLRQIYGTFNNAMIKTIPMLRGYADALTSAMIQMYIESQKRFTPSIQPHYVYSPRELTRWTRAIYEAIAPLDGLPLEGLVRIWAHEGLRLFSDRLITDDERQWTNEAVDRVALEHFPTIDSTTALQRPILFSDWLTKDYLSVDRGQLRDYVQARMKTFCEEELDVPLVLFDDLLDHVLRIDRVFRQPQGHMILIGASGSGKTTLSRFVAWHQNLSVFQIRIHSKYSAANFDEDLRSVLRRSGCQGERVCFIMDESNVLDSGFLERMNTLLANGEVPGLFEGDEFAALMTACREGSQRDGLILDSQEELYRWFTQQIVRNLHVVFTMNPPSEGLSSRAATSPALFNRCVLDWFGDWSDQALFQVGYELTQSIDLDLTGYSPPEGLHVAYRGLQSPASHRDVVINAMVHVHHSLRRFGEKLLKQQGRLTFLTPRHHLEFVAQFTKIYHEKRDDLEEQQRHLNTGLDKLQATVREVDDMSQSLAGKKLELERKGAEANARLQDITEEQNKLTSRRTKLVELQTYLAKQDEVINERKEQVESQLAEATPAVEEAQRSVNNIKKQQLTEVRSMQNPPASVKMALEAVCTLLGHRATDWKSIISIVRREDFIQSIVYYDNERQMTPEHRGMMKREYLSKDDFTFDRVNRASKACGPLVQWVEAQVNFSSILAEVGPLREELATLEDQSLDTRANAIAMQKESEVLETSLAKSKSDYETLVGDVASIKAEMNRISAKVERSTRLLDSLGSEKDRWERSNKTFEEQLGTIAGDTFMAAAFTTYAGLYDQTFRRAMLEDWSSHLSSSNVAFKPHNPVSEYLSTASERQAWQENTLPNDDLNLENAIMLKRCERYPLIIDPSGRVVHFLQKQCRNQKLMVTSFLDSSFVKNLESALRFGNEILIQDAEHLDPILNQVLNKEYQRKGGRVLIQLGKQEIDFSPTFKLYMTTRDPSKAFPPDICSRTTIVNFTVTQGSLRAQALNDVVSSERPDVEERRLNLFKTQGEFRLRLRHLEAELLRALNDARGNLLENDNVIKTLETLKSEANEIAVKAAETDGVMAEIDQITASYNVIANACASIFAVLDNLHHLNHFYQFSLQYFLDIFHQALKSSRAGGTTDQRAKVDAIIKALFVTTYRRAAASLVHKDRVTFALMLAQAAPSGAEQPLLDYILDDSLVGSDVSTDLNGREASMTKLQRLRPFKELRLDTNDGSFASFLGAEEAEQRLPSCLWSDGTAKLDQLLRGLVAVKLLRNDRLVPCTELFVHEMFGISLLDIDDDLGQVADEATATQPVALNSSPGFDASYKVEQLVARSGRTCSGVAMGSAEGIKDADSAIREAAVSGGWVLVRNVHLASQWLQNLEKRIELLKPHPDFRLFLSMESTPKIPVNLLRASRVLTFERPAGIRANMRDSLSSLPSTGSSPVEKTRVYFLVCYLHAIIQERLRYAPRLGWQGFWEFNDADLESCLFTIADLVDAMAKGRSNVAPSDIPWAMLRVLVAQTYGGKIDNDDDLATLTNLVTRTLTPSAFEDNFDLSVVGMTDSKMPEGHASLVVPTGTTKSAFVEWVNNVLPEREPPVYLGLPADAEKLLLVAHAEEMVRNARKIAQILDEREAVPET